MKRVKYLLLLMLFSLNAIATPCNQHHGISEYQNLAPILSNSVSNYPALRSVLSNPQLYKLQVIYTQINRDQLNKPQLTAYTLGLDEQQYFYPASTVKLPISLLALEWLNQQPTKVVSLESSMLTDASEPWQTSALKDASSLSGFPSIGNYIKKILLVSDNEASNRLYELLGQELINKRLRDLGLTDSVINHRLSIALSEQQNRLYNPIRFVDQTGKLLLSIPARSSDTPFINPGNPTIGKGFIADGQQLDVPMDFSHKNRLSLTDLDSIVKRIIFPELFSRTQQFDISDTQRQFVLRYMAMLPGESESPRYEQTAYPDNYSKFFAFSPEDKAKPQHMRIFNKTGWAYGHLIDSSYITDPEHNIEFFLSAVIYTNSNGILNDDQYETEQIGLPFLQELGKYLYLYELERRKSVVPDLTEFSRIFENL